jgi:hypothetical protein
MITKVHDNDDIRNQIAAIAASALDNDRRQASQIIAQARVGDYESEKASMTPGTAAIIFIEHNPHNRDWKPPWSQELVRRMDLGQWEPNGDTIRFYQDGALADGQNRLAAIALSGKTIEVIIVYGLARKAIVTIDGGKPRYASDAAKLSGIDNAKRKEQIIKAAASYLVRSGHKDAQLRSEAEVAREISVNNPDLETAINLGIASKENIVTPTLKEFQAQTVAYLMLKGGWPIVRIREKLAVFQSGVSAEGESSPFFVAAQFIERSRAATNKREKLTTTRELGVVMFAMVESEKGTRALGKQKFRDAVKKAVPEPEYPGEQQEVA